MWMSDDVVELFKALAQAQGEIKPLVKDIQVTMHLKSGKSINYDYIDYGSILEAVQPIITKHGLSVIQPLGTHQGKDCIFTQINHSSGQWIRSASTISYEKLAQDGHMVPMTEQEKGSAQSYMRRYSYVGMLCVPLKDTSDDDAIKASEPKEEKKYNPDAFRESLSQSSPPPTPKTKNYAPGSVSKETAVDLISMAKKNQWNEEEFKSYMMMHYKVDSAVKLSSAQAKSFKDALSKNRSFSDTVALPKE